MKKYRFKDERGFIGQFPENAMISKFIDGRDFYMNADTGEAIRIIHIDGVGYTRSETQIDQFGTIWFTPSEISLFLEEVEEKLYYVLASSTDGHRSVSDVMVEEEAKVRSSEALAAGWDEVIILKKHLTPKLTKTLTFE